MDVRSGGLHQIVVRGRTARPAFRRDETCIGLAPIIFLLGGFPCQWSSPWAHFTRGLGRCVAPGLSRSLAAAVGSPTRSGLARRIKKSIRLFSSNIPLTSAADCGKSWLVTIIRFGSVSASCSGSGLYISKPRRPARVKVSSFGV